MKPEDVLLQFDIPFSSITPISVGLVHATWKIESDTGEQYILQRVPSLFAPVVMEDINAVLEHLSEKGFLVEKIVRTKTGGLCLIDGEVFWRVFTYLDGTVVTDVEDVSVAESAGELLGAYHRALEHFSYEFKHVRSIKHNIPERLAAYHLATDGKLDPELAALAEPIELLPSLVPPASLRHTVTHGDTKISNFIFSKEKPLRAISIIDLDDCGRQYNVTLELAKAFRSWCQTREESPENAFNLEFFEQGLRGYVRGSNHFLTPEEWAYLPQAMKLLPLELAARFLADVFENTYFAWDSTQFASRKEHNLARFRGQILLYKDIVAKEKKIAETINTILGKNKID